MREQAKKNSIPETFFRNIYIHVKVNVCNDQETAQSERKPHSKNRDGEKN